MELVDRSRERDLLTGLLAQAAEGISAAVVVRGEPGIGKTALLDVVAARAVFQGMRVARVTGVEAEVPLGYAALHQTPAQLAGSAALPDPLPAVGSLQQMFSRRLGRLSPGARLLLATAAAEPAAADTVLWRAAERLGLDADLAVSEVSGLAEFGAGVGFRHPLVRSVAYHSMPAVRRRLIHRILAEVTDGGEQPDRVAWHLAMAATGPDEELAARLADVAGRAMERGGYAATTAFLARAAELSADGQLRTGRLLVAADAALTAGHPVQARTLLDQAESGATGDEQLATALRLAGQVSFATGRPGDAARQLLAAAQRLLPLDARLGRRTLLAALTAANYAGKDALEQVLAFAKGAAETPVDLRDPSSTADCLLLGFVQRLSGAPKQAAPLLRAAIGHLRAPATPDRIRMPVPIAVGVIAGTELMDDNINYDMINTYVRSARRAGALMVLPAALSLLASQFLVQGRFNDAQEACAEGRALGEATGAPGSPDLASIVELGLWCWRGREQEAQDLAARITAQVQRRKDQDRQIYHPPWYYLVVLELGLGRYRQAYDHALPAFQADRLAIGTIFLLDLIEAAARCDELPVAQQALNRLEERAQASGAHQGLGLLACCQALLAGDAAEPLYRQAIELLEQTAIHTELARARLLYGEWLRRQRRRRDARAQLRTAHDMFTQMGAGAFAARASAELAATGERPRQRSPERTQTLTPQEAQVARLVTQGGTNRDVAAELFISPATVEYHLRKVYQKLGITSRTQLARSMLSSGDDRASPAEAPEGPR